METDKFVQTVTNFIFTTATQLQSRILPCRSNQIKIPTSLHKYLWIIWVLCVVKYWSLENIVSSWSLCGTPWLHWNGNRSSDAVSELYLTPLNTHGSMDALDTVWKALMCNIRTLLITLGNGECCRRVSVAYFAHVDAFVSHLETLDRQAVKFAVFAADLVTINSNHTLLFSSMPLHIHSWRGQQTYAVVNTYTDYIIYYSVLAVYRMQSFDYKLK